MTTEADPIVGNWYRLPGRSLLFFVVDVDAVGDAIEIQYFDGSIEELNFAGWAELNVECADQPEDWTGPLDDLTRADLED